MISKIEFKCFQINLMLELFVFKVGIIKINFNFLFIKNNISFFKFLIPIVLVSFLLFTFFLEFALFFFHFFPNKNCQVKKTQNQKNMLVGALGCGGGGGRGIQLFKPKISPN